MIRTSGDYQLRGNGSNEVLQLDKSSANLNEEFEKVSRATSECCRG